MESDSHSACNYGVRPYAKILTALLCFILVLFSFIFMHANSYASASKKGPAQTETSTLTIIKTGTLTSTPTATATATNTPTPTPTATNTPTPTATSTPRPTPTATQPPKRTPTATATLETTPIPTATATGVKATPAARKVTASSSTGQTPTSVPGRPVTTTSNDTANGKPSAAGQQGSGLGIAFFPFITGALLLMGAVIVFGFLLLRKKLLPPQPVKVNLPPSGAQPWRRVRTESLSGNTNIVAAPLQDNGPTLIVPMMAINSSEPATEKIKLATRRGTRLVKLEETRQKT